MPACAWLADDDEAAGLDEWTLTPEEAARLDYADVDEEEEEEEQGDGRPRAYGRYTILSRVADQNVIYSTILYQSIRQVP